MENPDSDSRRSQEKDSVLNLRPGEIVEVRDEKEILATLDQKGTLEGLPFMPMMRKYCNKKFRVFKRTDKMIVEGVGMRHIRNTVILEQAVCEGDVQENCKRSCMILWKEAWLKRIEGEKYNSQRTQEKPNYRTDVTHSLPSGVFICQSRSLVEASSPLSKWDIRRYIWDLTSGVYTPSEFLRTLLYPVLNRARGTLAGTKPKLSGVLKRTPSLSLDLRPGDIVKVKSKEEILKTLDRKGRNRGLEFTAEMEKYCGKTFRVMKRLDKMVNEETGKMRLIANTVLLEGVNCDGKAHGGCPRYCYCLWRDIWLEKV